jgi:hypothetical protein
MNLWLTLLWLHYDITLTLIDYIVSMLKIGYNHLYYNCAKNNMVVIIIKLGLYEVWA